MGFPLTFPFILGGDPVDKVRPLKLESIDTGGNDDDIFPTSTNPDEDYISCKGISFEDSDNQLIDIDGSGNMVFTDTVSGGITLASLLGGGGLTPSTHKILDQLVHDIAETSYTELIRSGGVVTDVIIWNSIAKTKKIRETNITRSSGSVSQVVDKQYDSSGSLTESLTQVISRDGSNQIVNITNTLV